eukprot:m51a1_g9097 hypothetical protein (203) ;mRNA; f:72248-73063
MAAETAQGGPAKGDLFFQMDDRAERLLSDVGAPPDRLRESLRTLFEITDQDPDRSIVLEDMFFHALQFAFDHSYTAPKTWAFLSILKRLHTASMLGAKALRMEDSFALFKSMLVSHSIQRPPYSVRVFSLDEAKLITRYVTHTYYRHYKLYQYVFTKRRLLDLSQRQVVIQVPPDIPPLSIATLVLPATASVSALPPAVAAM